LPSDRRAVTTATPEASEAMASWNSSPTSVKALDSIGVACRRA
jgi:hypothetical protein